MNEDEINQCIKQAKFYLRYKDNPNILIKEEGIRPPESCIYGMYTFPLSGYTGRESDYGKIGIAVEWDIQKYNEWLFKLAFKSVLEVEK